MNLDLFGKLFDVLCNDLFTISIIVNVLLDPKSSSDCRFADLFLIGCGNV